MDQFKNLFNCSLCNEILVSPVTIACGNNVCKRHLDQILESLSNSEKQSFKCQLCHNVHSLSINDLIINKQIQNILDTEFYKMKININCFEECKQTLEDTNETFSMFESISKDPESHIYEYFQEIKNKVDIRREELKAKIDTYSDDILKSIDLKRLSCIKLSSNFNQTASEIEQLKKELDELFKQFNNFEINQNKYETLKRNADILKDKFAQKVIVYKESLILNKDYSFVCKDTSIEDIFGRLDLKDTSSDVTETSVKKDAGNYILSSIIKYRYFKIFFIKYKKFGRCKTFRESMI